MPLRRLEARVEINRPIKDVIDFVDDHTNDPLWQSSVIESQKLTDGPPAKGTIYHVKEKFLGRILEQKWEVVERSEDGSYWKARTISGPFPMETTMRFEADGDKTIIHRTLSIDVGRFFKLASPAVAHIAQRELDMDFANLKEIIESGAYRRSD